MKYFCFFVVLSLATIRSISADGVAIIIKPLPTQINQVTLQDDNQDIVLSDFNNLEVELTEAAAILIELTELANEWEWNAEWITESNEQILLITNDHGEELLIGPNSVTSNAENLEFVTVGTGTALGEAIEEAENLVEEFIHEAFESVTSTLTEVIQSAANNLTESAQGAVTEAITSSVGDITGSLSNVGNSLTSGFSNS